jgi:Family of unknown function (DUF5343)
MENPEKKKAAPPYVAYKTLSNFLDRFKQGLPGRIDRGLMASMSGAAQSQVTTALRYLGMISENGIPTQLMRRYATGEEEERKAAISEMLSASYPFIFGEGDFDLTSATASMLREAFDQNTTATGETLVRCMAFFKDAAADAGIQISQFITQKKGRIPGAKKRVSVSKKEERRQEPAPATTQQVHQKPIVMAAQSSLLLSGLFQRLPAPGSTWGKVDREQWLQTLQNVLLLEYPEN